MGLAHSVWVTDAYRSRRALLRERAQRAVRLSW